MCIIPITCNILKVRGINDIMKLLAGLFIITLTILPSFTRAEEVTIAAAISTKDALVEIGALYQEQTKEQVQFAFGASGQLITQIKNGAPLDAFISAANSQVDQLEKEKLSVEGSRRLIVRNVLVLIVPANSKLNLTTIGELNRPEVKRIAIGQPKAVPAGEYALQTLKSLDLESTLTPRLINGANVRQVLDYVIRGEVDAGFVYSTDAQAAGAKVKVVAAAPADAHDPIEYPAVIVAASKKQEATRKFLDYLATPEAQRIFIKHGFVVARNAADPATQPAPPKADRHGAQPGASAFHAPTQFRGCPGGSTPVLTASLLGHS